ncbi:MAG: ABC transporter substrate-binding protein [Bacilli bacterium]|nr:ABC transporter substrate-binding protein [Bacilli bacterium]
MKKFLVFMLMFVASLTMVGCGQSLPELDVEEYEVPAVPAGLVQGVTATTVLVGNTAPKTGAFGIVGIPFSAAIEAVFADYNANRDEGDREIVYITYDDQTDPAVGLTNTKKLVEEDNVFALVGHVGTGTVGATLPYLLEEHVPMVYAATGINNLYFEDTPGNPIFAVQPIYKTDGRIAYARAINEALFGENKDEVLPEKATVGVLYTNDDAGKSIAAGIIEEARNQGREKYLVVYSFEDATIESTVSSLLRDEPDVIIVAGNQAPFNNALVALDDVDNVVPVITSYVNTNASSITLQEYNFDIYGSAWIDIVDPEGTYGFSAEYWQFVTVMTAAGYGNLGADNNYTANAFAMAGYVAAKVFVQGWERLEDSGDDITWANFIAAMEESPIDIPMGGMIDYTNGKRWGIDSMALSQLIYTPAAGETPASQAFVKVADIQSIDEINGEE